MAMASRPNGKPSHDTDANFIKAQLARKAQEKGRSPSPLEALKVYTLFIGFGIATISFVLWMYATAIPVPKPDSAPLGEFSEGRAWKHLLATQSIGKSLVGTKANDQIADYIKAQLAIIQSKAKELKQTNPSATAEVEISVQHPSGSLNFEFLGTVITNVYTNLTNVIARVSYGEETKQSAILVNTHFDTPMDSPGAMDARTCVAVMLELTRAATHLNLNHALIFLFNGAEESLQEGSHGFITQHHWAPTVKTVLNFDAGGVGGSEVLFQTGGAQWTEAFAKSAPRPHGAVLAQDLFKTGLLQSDTDYRIFRDFGNVVGIDLAFYKDGYLYHTDRDVIENLQAGSIQHEGDNALAYLQYIATHPTLVAEAHRGQKNADAVFLDFLGRYMMVYPMAWQFVMSAGLIVVVLGYLALVERPAARLGPILKATGFLHIAFISSIVACVILGLIIQFVLNKHMTWYSHWWIAVVLYSSVSLSVSVFVYNALVAWKLEATVERRQMENTSSWAVLLLLVHILFWSSIGKLGSSFMFFWMAAGYFGMILLSKSPSAAPRILGWTYPLATFLPIWWTTTFAYPVLCLFIPLTGRLGKDAPVESVIAVLVGFFFFIGGGVQLVPLSIRARNKKILAAFFGILILVSFIAACTLFPYSYYQPKRLVMQHVHRVERTPDMEPSVVDTSTALLFAGCDPGTYGDALEKIQEALEKVPNHPPVDLQPHSATHDWLAIYPFSVFMTGFVTKAPPIPDDFMVPPEFQVELDEYNAAKDERHLVLGFEYSGSEFSTLKFAGNLLRWNLTDVLPETPRGYYALRHIGRHGLNQWGIDMTFRGNEPVDFHLTSTHFADSAYVDALVPSIPDWSTFVTLVSIIRARRI